MAGGVIFVASRLGIFFEENEEGRRAARLCPYYLHLYDPEVEVTIRRHATFAISFYPLAAHIKTIRPLLVKDHLKSLTGYSLYVLIKDEQCEGFPLVFQFLNRHKKTRDL